jgi:hypothetical protein
MRTAAPGPWSTASPMSPATCRERAYGGRCPTAGTARAARRRRPPSPRGSRPGGGVRGWREGPCRARPRRRAPAAEWSPAGPGEQWSAPGPARAQTSTPPRARRTAAPSAGAPGRACGWPWTWSPTRGPWPSSRSDPRPLRTGRRRPGRWLLRRLPRSVSGMVMHPPCGWFGRAVRLRCPRVAGRSGWRPRSAGAIRGATGCGRGRVSGRATAGSRPVRRRTSRRSRTRGPRRSGSGCGT